MVKWVASAIGLTALAGCFGEPLTFEATPLSVQRFYAETFQDQAFDEGAVTVLAAEHGELRSYTLRPCRNNTHVCGTRAGHLIRTEDFAIVTGAFPGRTFYLSPGGDGVMRHHGQDISIAWNE